MPVSTVSVRRSFLIAYRVLHYSGTRKRSGEAVGTKLLEHDATGYRDSQPALPHTLTKSLEQHLEIVRQLSLEQQRLIRDWMDK